MQESGSRSNETGSFPVVSGIGVALKATPLGAKIAAVIPNSAAADAGKLHDGDILLSLSEGGRTISLAGKTTADIVNLIRGPVGTTITLEVKPATTNRAYVVTITRKAVPLPGFISYAGLVGKMVSNATFSRLEKLTSVELHEYKGKIVILDFWASWCGACYKSLNKLQKIARAHSDWDGRVVLLAATIDTNKAAALDVIKERGWNEIQFLGFTPKKMEAMNIQTIPTLLIISPEGRIVTVGDPHAISIESQVSRLLSR